MPKVSAQVTIDAPADRVWEVLADFGAIYKWAPGITNSYSTSESNGGPDASRHCDIAGFGSVEEYVIEWTEGREFKYRATPVGPIGESISTWRVTPQGSKAVLYGDLEYKIRFGPIGALAHKLFMGRMMRQAMNKTLAGFKHHVETGEPVDQKTKLPKSTLAAVTA